MTSVKRGKRIRQALEVDTLFSRVTSTEGAILGARDRDHANQLPSRAYALRCVWILAMLFLSPGRWTRPLPPPPRAESTIGTTRKHTEAVERHLQLANSSIFNRLHSLIQTTVPREMGFDWPDQSDSLVHEGKVGTAHGIKIPFIKGVSSEAHRADLLVARGIHAADS